MENIEGFMHPQQPNEKGLPFLAKPAIRDLKQNHGVCRSSQIFVQTL